MELFGEDIQILYYYKHFTLLRNAVPDVNKIYYNNFFQLRILKSRCIDSWPTLVTNFNGKNINLKKDNRMSDKIKNKIYKISIISMVKIILMDRKMEYNVKIKLK